MSFVNKTLEYIAFIIGGILFFLFILMLIYIPFSSDTTGTKVGVVFLSLVLFGLPGGLLLRYGFKKRNEEKYSTESRERQNVSYHQNQPNTNYESKRTERVDLEEYRGLKTEMKILKSELDEIKEKEREGNLDDSDIRDFKEDANELITNPDNKYIDKKFVLDMISSMPNSGSTTHVKGDLVNGGKNEIRDSAVVRSSIGNTLSQENKQASKENIELYENLLRKALEDRKISEEEKRLLKDIRDKFDISLDEHKIMLIKLKRELGIEEI